MKTFGHPKGLYVLFLTEMWETFSFSGMRALLIFYMTKHLLFDQAYASNVYGIYIGLIYFTPLIGGILSDKLLGPYITTIIGCILMSIGHFCMMSEFLFYPALLLLILGHGAISPNIILQLKSLYKKEDHEVNSAFSIFYLGINLGPILSPIVCGTLGELYGWHYGFGAAGIGMIIGLFTFILGRKHILQNNNTSSCHYCLSPAQTNLNISWLQDNKIKNKLIGFLILILFGALFKAIYGQLGNTIALCIDNYTDRHILNWNIPASWFQALNPLTVVLMTPFITKLWSWQSKHHTEPTSLTKMAIGCILAGISFIFLIPTVSVAQTQEQAHILWPIVSIFTLTIGELYFCPIALLLVSKIAPTKIASMVIGLWYLSYFMGNCLSGFLGGFWNKLPKGGFFLFLSLFGLIIGFGIIATSKFLKRKLD